MKSIECVLRRIAFSFALAIVFAQCGYGQEVRDRVVLTVHVGQSRMLRLDRPVASVFVADPATADVQVVSSQVLFVFGKAVGRTSVAALEDDGGLIGRWNVSVALDLEPVRSALSEGAEFRNLQVRPLRQGVEISGVVASTAAVDRALQLARAALPEKVAVINRMGIINNG